MLHCKMVVKSDIIKSPHAFSTRNGGVSEGIFSSLNLGMNRGDDIDKVKENWNRFLKASDIESESFVCGKQVHGNYVHIATKEDLRPAYGPGELIEADGYVTNEKNVPLAVFTADCVPLIMEDAVSGVVGAIHSGWRSTVADIEGQAVMQMEKLGAKAENICVAIGPAICGKCFQVGQEVVDGIDKLLGYKDDSLYVSDPDNEGKYFLDLRAAIYKRLLQLGVRPENIEISEECTMCLPDKYWSHRYTNGERGSQANIIMLQ